MVQLSKMSPTKEIAISYKDDQEDNQETAKNNNKNIIEIPKKRPSWFSKVLTTKAITDKQKQN